MWKLSLRNKWSTICRNGSIRKEKNIFIVTTKHHSYSNSNQMVHFAPEWWCTLLRNGGVLCSGISGVLCLGMVVYFASEWWSTIPRNGGALYLGISNTVLLQHDC